MGIVANLSPAVKTLSDGGVSKYSIHIVPGEPGTLVLARKLFRNRKGASFKYVHVVYGPACLEEVLNVVFEVGLGEVADVAGDVGFG
jgi:hypothetical protein